MCIFLFSNFSYKRRGVYRKRYLNEIWALIDGTDYLVSFLDTSESREYINRSSRGHLINSLPVLKLSEQEIDDLKKKIPHRPILRYTYHPSDATVQSGSLYERYNMKRLAGSNIRSGNHERHSYSGFCNENTDERYPRNYNDEFEEEEEENDDDNNENDSNNNNENDSNNNNENDSNSNNENDSNSNNENDSNNNNKTDSNNNNENGSNNNNEDEAIINNENDSKNNNENDSNNNNENDSKSHNENDLKSHNENDSNSHNENDLKSHNENDSNSHNEDDAKNEDGVDFNGVIVRDIFLNQPYPPELGPNNLGIDAFDLQQKALREDQLSSDDGDERPSNCGCGHDGSGEVVLQISLKYFIPYVNQEYKDNFTINTIPRSEWETIKAKGFDWILFEDLPPTTDFKELAATLHSCRLKAMMDYQSDEPINYFDGFRIRDSDVASYRHRFQDKTIVSVQSYTCPWKNEGNESNESENQNPLNYATYIYDNRPIECLKARDSEAFARVVRKETKENDRCHLLHYMCAQNLNFNPRSTRTAAAMLLTLPGMRVIDFTEIQLVDLVLIVLCKKAVRRGVFTFVNYKSTGNTFAWKYTRGSQHVLIVANFDTRQTTTTIICDDCPKPIESGKGKKDNGKVAFVDILSQTRYLRDPEEMRTKGLNVILYEYEAQIFEY